MGKGQYRDRDRDKRKRGFDDDSYTPQDAREARQSRPYSSPPAREAFVAEGPVVDAVVKMFNTEKGFGFVELAGGSGDAFLHVATLQASGHDAPAPGSKLKVQVGQGQKGPQVTAVLEVDASTAAPVRPRAPRAARPDPATAIELDGTVKWFNAEKGFGFVQADDGGKDVFLHISVVERAGLTTLAEGAPVSIRVVESQKGREAISVAVMA
jgi:CspA family cold shock protein